PDGPMRVTRSPLFTEKLRSLSTTWSPKRFSTSSNKIAGVPFPAAGLGTGWGSRCVDKALFQSSDKKGSGIGSEEENNSRKRDRLGVSEVRTTVRLRSPHKFGQRDHEQERGVLEHRNDVVPESRNRGTERLGYNNGEPSSTCWHR